MKRTEEISKPKLFIEELERLRNKRPVVVSHTACTDHVLLDLFGYRVER